MLVQDYLILDNQIVLQGYARNPLVVLGGLNSSKSKICCSIYTIQSII